MLLLSTEPIVKNVFKSILYTEFAGKFNLNIYLNTIDSVEHLAIVKGKINSKKPIPVRVHKVDYINDIFHGSLSNNKNPSDYGIRNAMIEFDKIGDGVLLIIREANIASISKKLRDKNKKEISDFREYGIGAQILRDLGVREMILFTKKHKSMIGLEGFDLKIVDYKNIEC